MTNKKLEAEILEFMSSKEFAPIDRVNFVKQRIEEAKEECRAEWEKEQGKKQKEEALNEMKRVGKIVRATKSEIISKIKGRIKELEKKRAVQYDLHKSGKWTPNQWVVIRTQITGAEEELKALLKEVK